MEKLTKDMERIGQYATKKKARDMANRETNLTGQKHHIQYAVCPRIQEDCSVLYYSCWTTCLG